MMSRACPQLISLSKKQFAAGFSTCQRMYQKYNEPLSGHEMPRAGGIASMMRLPVQNNTEGLDACFVGVPLDIGTSNRSGTRHGPRQIRCESSLIRKVNIATGACPFDSMQVADVGDVNLNLYNLPKACEDIRKHFLGLVQAGCEKHGPVGLVHIDAHADTNDKMLGESIAHGTPFRRAFEEGCLVGNKVIQIGLRGSNYTLDDYEWGKKQPTDGGSASDDGRPPSTPEIGGLTSIQGLEIVRGCRGLNIVGGDLVEVSPPYDFQGTTALTAANLLFEMLCVLPKVKYGLR
ncbi:SPEB-like protein [Mya arenaria]|uniref:SPEB-like protein n=1 Tax=Mya arenaria TaxID=6604 RepID=A0ABY7G281_MYAAR|nr:SPEB-like protein [Mya arenaria]